MKAEGSPSQSSKEGRLIVGNLVGEGQSTRYQGLIEVAQAEQWTGWRGNQYFSLGDFEFERIDRVRKNGSSLIEINIDLDLAR